MRRNSSLGNQVTTRGRMAQNTQGFIIFVNLVRKSCRIPHKMAPLMGH